MGYLQDYAKYLLKHKLDQLAEVQLRKLRELNPPVLAHFEHEGAEGHLELVKHSMTQFLEALIEGKELLLLEQKSEKWEKDLVKGIDRTAITLTDIVLISVADKVAMATFLGEYTKRVKVALAVMEELEGYYTQVHVLAAATISRIQEAEKLKRAESEERYRDIFENASDLIHIVSPEGQILYANKAWHDSLGYTEEDLKHISIYDVVVERERDRYRAYRDRIVSGLPALENLNTFFRTKDGREIAIEGYLTCKYRDGKPQYTRSILRDVTLRRAAEQQIQFYTAQLVEREENIRQLIRNAPDAIIVIDAESRIKLWNPKAETMFGWLAMDVVGKDLTELIIPPRYREPHRQGMKRHLETGEERVMNRTIEITALNVKGEEFYISLTISKTTQAGEPVFIAFVRDISDIRKNALELQKKSEELERSNQELEQFAWLASHDLKEPLRKIHTFSDMILRQRGQLPANTARYLQKIQHSAQRMTNLIEDILSYSNVSNDEGEYVLTDLNSILQDVLIDMEVAINEKRAKVIVDNLPVAEVLPFQIRQLFQNLLSNSIKYSKPDVPPVIEITASTVEGKLLQISVKDNGIGFNRDYAEKAFQIFQRLVPKTEYEGTGIGLALCKKIVENHNGTISAESEEGVGSTFLITMPVQHETQKQSPAVEI